MNRHRLGQLAVVLTIVAAVLWAPLSGGRDPLDPIRNLPTQIGGRVRPFDSYARQLASLVRGRREVSRDGVLRLEPTAWVLSMMANPDRWKGEPIIHVPDGIAIEAFGLDGTRAGYSFDELSHNDALRSAFTAMADGDRRPSPGRRDRQTRDLATLRDTLDALGGVFTMDGVRVVPDSGGADGRWRSLRDLDGIGAEPFVTARSQRDAMLRRQREGDSEGAGRAAASLASTLATIDTGGPDWTTRRLRLEVLYNTYRPVHAAAVLYLLGAIALVAGLVLRRKVVCATGFQLTLAAFMLHSASVVVRIAIAGRPPVTNMYESLIWVAWGAVLLALVIGRGDRSRYLAAAGAAAASTALLLAERVPLLDGSIEPLVPILRDNMWLTVHVLTITLAYSAFALAMVLAHVGLAKTIVTPGSVEQEWPISLYIYRSLQAGVMLGLVGTALGGWWASYSWGRFWGWDAKETSAFVALMFYLAVLHARTSGWLREFGTAVASVLGFLLILWTWYGVNFVLATGLHSYGFGSGGYLYVGAFVAIELLFVASAAVSRSYFLMRTGSPSCRPSGGRATSTSSPLRPDRTTMS